MNQSAVATFECEVVSKEYLLVGQSVTAAFPQSFPEAAIKVQQQFENRREEIQHVVDKEIVFSPYMCNDIVATYFACIEVTEFGDIPEGMMALTLPQSKYAKVSCSNKTIDKGYEKIFSWIKEKGYHQKWFDKSFPIEIFYYEDGVEEERVELLIPIK
jgi:predicted transcriptional regulator YdeE